MVVPFLVRTRIASLTDYSKVPKITGRHKIHKCRRIRFPAVINFRKAEEKVKMSRRLPHLAVKWLDQLCHRTALLKLSFLCFTTNSVLVLAFLYFILCEVSVHMFVHICVQVKKSNGGNVFKIQSFTWSLQAPYLSFCSCIIIHSCLQLSNSF